MAYSTLLVMLYTAKISIDLSKSDNNLQWNHMMNVIAFITYIKLLST